MGKLDITELTKMPNINVTVTVEDLMRFGRSIASEAVDVARKEMRNEDRLIPLKEAARMLGCSERTVRRYISSDLLPACLHGGKQFFRLSDIQRYIAELFN